jgi:hypothetical protein
LLLPLSVQLVSIEVVIITIIVIVVLYLDVGASLDMDLAGCSEVDSQSPFVGLSDYLLALLAGLFSDPLDASLALGYALVADSDVGGDD